MPPRADPIEEARRIMEAAKERTIMIRMFGGLAFYFRCPSARHPALQRDYGDIDFMGHAKQAREVKLLFDELGYTPRDWFNALHGYRRMIFNDMENQRRVDVFFDVFQMCHRFDFKDRIELDNETLTLADMLITKLQIVELNMKDLQDITSIFVDHEIGRTDSPEKINGAYIAKLCSDDWGVYKTFTTNLANVVRTLSEGGFDGYHKEEVVGRINQLMRGIEEFPKSLKWRMRAKLGQRKRWYELPEADKDVFRSRPSMPGADASRITGKH